MRKIALDPAIASQIPPELVRLLNELIDNRRVSIGRRQPITISGGVFTIGRNFSYFKVDTESAGASDNLDTILGGNEGDVIFIEAANSARTVVLKDGTGNIMCTGGADISLGHADDLAMLIYDGAKWKANLWDISA